MDDSANDGRMTQRGAVAAGADLVVQSTHKTLTALTQAGMLHQGYTANESLGNAIAQTLPMVQSSSPSALLLASLDQASLRRPNFTSLNFRLLREMQLNI